MSSVMIARGKSTGGNTLIEWARQGPQVIRTVAIGDDMRVSIMQAGTDVYLSINERISCSNIDHAHSLFDGIVGEEAERRDVVAGGSSESVQDTDIPF